MSLEKYLSGFESGLLGEFRYAVGSGLPISTYFDINNTAGLLRSGSYSIKSNHANGVNSQVFLPAGIVTGTSGTVTSGNHKRFRSRVYFKCTANSPAFGNQFLHLYGLGPDPGYATILNKLATIANTGCAHIYLYADGRLGLYIPPATTPGSDGILTFTAGAITLNQWYQLIFDVDLNVGATTTVTLTTTITNEGGVAFNETITASRNIGATDIMGKVSFGSAASGGFQHDGTIYWDDLVWFAASNTDAISQLILPVETHIIPVTINGIAGAVVVNAGPDQIIYTSKTLLAGSVSTVPINTWGGGSTYTNVNEVPCDLTGTGSRGLYLESTAPTGSYIMFSHILCATLGISNVIAAKIIANILVASGTGSIDVLLGASVASALSNTNIYSANYPDNSATSNANPAGLISFLGWTAAQFDALSFGVRKQNGVQDTFLGNILAEVLYN
jgi:hypothetical protein